MRLSKIGDQIHAVIIFLHEHGYDINIETNHHNHYAAGRILAWQDVTTTITITDRHSHDVFLEATTDTSVTLWSYVITAKTVDLHCPHSLSKILEHVRLHKAALLEEL